MRISEKDEPDEQADMKDFNDFTNLYQLHKTLRFGLVPVGETLQNLETSGLLDQDRHRDESYAKVKELIDRYHKEFIERVLSNHNILDTDHLKEYERLYRLSNKDENDKDNMSKVQDVLRGQIHKAFKAAGCEQLLSSDFINTELPRFLKAGGGTAEELRTVEEFNGFTTYFGGFHENRANVYSKEAQSTAIGFRIIHENLPRFIDNIDTFVKLVAVDDLAGKLPALQEAFDDLLGGTDMRDIFSLDFYGRVLTQRQIETYNAVIGGKTDENGVKLQGLNEYVNLYNQQHPDAKLPLLKRLHKQILSDRENVSWLPEQFGKDHEVLAAVNGLWQDLSSKTLPALRDMLIRLNNYDADGIYLPNDLSLGTISQRIYGHWSVIKSALMEGLRSSNRKTTKKGKEESEEAYEERLEKLYKNRDSFSIGEIEKSVNAYLGPNGGGSDNSVVTYFTCLGGTETDKNLFELLDEAHQVAMSLLEDEYPESKKLVQDKNSVKRIKALLDGLKALQHFVKPLLGHRDESRKDERFYGEFTPLWESLDRLTPLYNKVRNYLTQKPYSLEKIKLNFENSSLLSGWPVSMESANSGLLFRDGGNYYLGILEKTFKAQFNGHVAPQSEEDVIEKMFYMQGGDMGKNVQNLMVVRGKTVKKNGRREKSGPYAGQNLQLEDLKCRYLPAEINRIRLQKTYSTSSTTFDKGDLCKFIDYYKERVQEYYADYVFNFKESEDYDSFNDFTDHVKSQAYQVNFKPISRIYIDTLVKEGKLFLFQVYNKDFSPHSHGTPNMHTLYWRMLFDERNLANVVYQLNGGAEVFFRKRSITSDIIVHPKGRAITNKNPLNTKRESTFEYDIIKNRRFTVDKFQFHVPITINFKAQDASLNPMVRDILSQSTDVHIIGIDRGERNLLYLTVINQKGDIVEQRSLNRVGYTDFHELLERREQARQTGRNEWDYIEGIKDLKEGYLSQIVHQVTAMMVKYKAVVVLEDLNIGFMRGRQKVEKQVYRKFEKMLIDKLNYLVDKEADPQVAGGLLHAYQLTDKFESFTKIGKQNGFLFYIPAWNTSKIDPVTGFVNLLDTHYVNVDKSRNLFERMDAIRYNAEKDWFEFSIDYDKFTTKATGTRTRWILSTFGDRLETFRDTDKNNEWNTRSVNPTAELKTFFAAHGISLDDDLRIAILKQQDKAFFEPLLRLLRLTLQLRNSRSGSTAAKDDYIISPVCDTSGNFFDSREDHHGKLPQDADANGAYNIARKGLMIIRQLQEARRAGRDVNGKDFQFDLSNKAWLRFAQEKPYLNE